MLLRLFQCIIGNVVIKLYLLYEIIWHFFLASESGPHDWAEFWIIGVRPNLSMELRVNVGWSFRSVVVHVLARRCRSYRCPNSQFS